MVYKTEGIVLRTRNLGEADRIVTLYTRSRGKVVGVARGSRRIRNRLLSPTQVFTHGRYMLFAGKNMDTISQAEIIYSYQTIRDNLELMAYSAYVVELLDVLTEEGEAHQEIFALLSATLSLGCQGRFELVVRAFEIRLMKHLGYEPQLHHCLQCGSEVGDSLYFSRQGGVVCSNCRVNYPDSRALSNGTWEFLKKLVDLNFSRLSILRPSKAMLKEAESHLKEYIEYRLEKPLKSLGFLSTIQEISATEVNKP